MNSDDPHNQGTVTRLARAILELNAGQMVFLDLLRDLANAGHIKSEAIHMIATFLERRDAKIEEALLKIEDRNPRLAADLSDTPDDNHDRHE